MFLASGTTDKGRVRKVNEDRFAIDSALRLCIVADGMGGHNAGEVASTLAIDAIVDYLRAPSMVCWPFGYEPGRFEAGNRLRTAIHLANVRLLELSDTCSEYSGMGTTIVATLVEGNRVLDRATSATAASIGIGATRLERMTQDDSWLAQTLAQNPDADPEEFRNHPMRNVITNVVGATSCTDVHVIEESIVNGDVFLLMTDGVHGVIDDGCLAQGVRRRARPRSAERRARASGDRAWQPGQLHGAGGESTEPGFGNPLGCCA
jgi:protein phosphatase